MGNWFKNYLGSVHDLLGKALSNGLDVTEGGLASTGGEEPESLGDTTHWGDVDSLTADNTSGSNTTGILTRSGVDDGINKDLPQMRSECFFRMKKLEKTRAV